MAKIVPTDFNALLKEAERNRINSESLISQRKDTKISPIQNKDTRKALRLKSQLDRQHILAKISEKAINDLKRQSTNVKHLSLNENPHNPGKKISNLNHVTNINHRALSNQITEPKKFANSNRTTNANTKCILNANTNCIPNANSNLIPNAHNRKIDYSNHATNAKYKVSGSNITNAKYKTVNEASTMNSGYKTVNGSNVMNAKYKTVNKSNETNAKYKTVSGSNTMNAKYGSNTMNAKMVKDSNHTMNAKTVSIPNAEHHSFSHLMQIAKSNISTKEISKPPMSLPKECNKKPLISKGPHNCLNNPKNKLSSQHKIRFKNRIDKGLSEKGNIKPITRHPRILPPPSVMNRQNRHVASVCVNSNFKKSKRSYEDEDDEDDEDMDDMDDFIVDDDECREDTNTISETIQSLFKYNRNRHFDDDDSCMESSYADIIKEEKKSARLGMLEDLEDIMREEKQRQHKRKR